MGDRGNIFIDTDGDKGGVYLYTHWGGYGLPEVLRAALIRGKGRWNDPQYLARIIFCEMVRDDIDGVTGYGISSKVQDNDRPIIKVITAEEMVIIGEDQWSFEEYINEL